MVNSIPRRSGTYRASLRTAYASQRATEPRAGHRAACGEPGGQAGRPGGVDSGPGSPSPGRAAEGSPPGGPYTAPIKPAARDGGRPAKRGRR